MAVDCARTTEGPDPAHRAEVLGRLLRALAAHPDGLAEARSLARERLDDPDLDPIELLYWLREVLLVAGHAPGLGDLLDETARQGAAATRAWPSEDRRHSSSRPRPARANADAFLRTSGEASG